MTVYYVWGLLPLVLLFFALKAGWKRVFKMEGREYPRERFSQLVFCSVCLIVAIGLDQLFLGELLASMAIEHFDTRIFGWLIYPAVLVAGGFVQKLLGFDPDKNKEIDERRKGGRAMLTNYPRQ